MGIFPLHFHQISKATRSTKSEVAEDCFAQAIELWHYLEATRSTKSDGAENRFQQAKGFEKISLFDIRDTGIACHTCEGRYPVVNCRRNVNTGHQKI